MKEVITRNDVKLLLSVISIIVVVVFAWSDLKNDAKNAAREAASAKQETKETREQQNLMALDIREIKTILKQEGLTSTYQPIVEPLAITQPTPAAQSAQLSPTPQIIVNNYTQPTPEPTPTPMSPTPTPTPSPILCLGNLCISG